MYILDNLEPKNVFRFFEELSRIPRGSGDEKAASDYIVNFAKERGLEVYQDKALNVIIKKPATAGYENSPGVIIQGHIDMVNEKNQDVDHDFSKDPIKLVVDGDFIKAFGTTLGADNGVAVALAMAILDSSELKHPAIEVMLTTDEEVGMGGAREIDCSNIKGKRFINLDCGPEGYFFAGCAGGLMQVIRIKAERTNIPQGFETFALKVRGLKGGHSGACIHKELANSNKLLGRLLDQINSRFDTFLSRVSGGLKDNAIPREADALINIKESDTEKVIELVSKIENELKQEYRNTEPDLRITLEKTAVASEAFTKDCTGKVIKALMLIPYGVVAKSLDIEGLTETSTNLGVVETTDEEIKFNSATRSSVGTRKAYMKDQFKALAELLGAELDYINEYPAWEFNPESQLRDICVSTYEEMFGKKPSVTATHGGLECGILSEKLPGVDIVAFGPDAEGAHTPDEKLSIASMERTWRFLIKLLENLK
ncbi:aminoacyl-histidine dipeptidase [Anaeropeptidivorans aminofermentans]|jgi:dipeptidase D|uniref:aminoacyl-histidine dipeptidase n=1 Tax=Anaeropeptidivorans aminofermentans TaxID=2934315 RepID=UPI0020251589|nr:aminoacyl-histidine dipeptidase [Anaeropeptidivorans aminofermentans]